MNLWEYEGNRVRIKSKSEITYEGYADFYSYADDNATGIASLAVIINEETFMDFEENEIASIEIIPADIPAAVITGNESRPYIRRERNVGSVNI